MRTQFGFGSVGLQTGDASLNAEGDIVVMTTEILRNILFREGDASGEAILTKGQTSNSSYKAEKDREVGS